jgi:hypothetical protein
MRADRQKQLLRHPRVARAQDCSMIKGPYLRIFAKRQGVMKRFSSSREYRRSKRRYEQINSLFHDGEASSLLHTMIAPGPGVTTILAAGGALYAVLLVFL